VTTKGKTTDITPGPWTYGRLDGDAGFFVRGDVGTPVTELPSNGHADPYAEADARLIASAPDLLSAVIHLLRRIGEDPGGVGYHAGFATEVFERAVRAYAKALGRDESEVINDVINAQKANRDDEEELRMLRRRIDAFGSSEW